jgi:hypothetical protein
LNKKKIFYVFFDTADSDFITRISNKYCPIILEHLYNDYDQVKQLNGDRSDSIRLDDYFKNGTGKTLFYLNCKFLSLSCSCKSCCDCHKAVLTTDQIECFSEEFRIQKTKYMRDIELNDPDNLFITKRIVFQEMCQRYLNKRKEYIDELLIKDANKKNLQEYLRIYLLALKKYKKLNHQNYMYVRDDVKNSDYTLFSANIGHVHNLLICDDISAVV